jgi:hypothetical protein
MKEHRDASGRLTISLGDDGPMFGLYAARLEANCKGRRVHQLDGSDRRYWDYDVEGTTTVLHSDVFAGISLHVEDGSRDDLLRRVAAQITELGAAPNSDSAEWFGNSGVGGGPPSVG